MRRKGLDNELNIGLGLNYTVHEDARGVGFVEAGFYRDSGSHLANDFTRSLGLRAEWERYRVDDAVGNKADIDMWSLGLLYSFGQ